ncbi:hypothetical protein [Streptomyces sp. NBC_01716]|uniref:hypothetical protein n=1 Tax=Streptomyces sp. NBC_01716 TaxID=2975917 RepID=UPI002E37F39C|nr:hypothetical protein [Streptomyces sp. NBC_01716]
MSVIPPVQLSVLDTTVIGRTAESALADTIALAQHAERLGYARYWMAEHLLAEPAGQSASFQFATRPAGTDNGRPGMPVYSPTPGSATVSQLELPTVLGQERSTPSGTDPRSEARTDR